MSTIKSAAFIHPTAVMYGDVRLSEGSSVWPNVVMRAESEYIEVGKNSNIQDFAMLHVGYKTPTIIGENCSITHHCTIHGCIIEDNCLIGINATIMDGAVIGKNSIIGPHTLVREGQIIPANSVVVGTPAVVTKTRDNYVANKMNAWMYLINAQAYAKNDYRVWSSDWFKKEALIKQQEFELEAKSTG
jgi:carbonic anhydrase/acetyltransferase-like protein (isoleucine patch superfamily)